MTTRERIREFIGDGEALLLEPEMFDDAILGVAERCGQPTIVAYSRNRCIEILESEYEMDRDEANEYFEFNIAGSWVGEGTPVFIDERYAE
jgi:hypothetical protein